MDVKLVATLDARKLRDKLLVRNSYNRQVAFTLVTDAKMLDALVERTITELTLRDIWLLRDTTDEIPLFFHALDYITVGSLKKLLKAMPVLVKLHTDDERMCFHYAMYRPAIIELLIDNMQKLPISQRGEVAVNVRRLLDESNAIDETTTKSLTIIIEKLKGVAESQWWLDILLGGILVLKKEHLIHLVPPTWCHFASDNTILSLIAANWSDKIILEFVQAGANINANYIDSYPLKELVLHQKWDLLLQLHQTLGDKIDWNKTDSKQMTALHYLYLGCHDSECSLVAQPNFTAIPAELKSIMIQHTDLRISNVNGYTIFYLLYTYEKWTELESKLLGRKFNLNEPQLLQNTAAKSWTRIPDKFIVDNYLLLLQNIKPYRYSDYLCAKKPTRQCKEKLLDRCKRTGVCYPATTNWKALKLLEFETKLSNQAFPGTTTHGNIYLTSIITKYIHEFSRGNGIAVPFHWDNSAETINSKVAITNMRTNFVADIKSVYSHNFAINNMELFPAMYPAVINIAVSQIKGTSLYFDHWMHSAFKNAMQTGARWITMWLSMVEVSKVMGHANILLYDTQKHHLDRFDPMANYDTFHEKDIDLEIKTKLLPIINSLTGKSGSYSSNSEFEAWIGIQTADRWNFPLNGQPEGYCLTWIMLWLELRIINPHYDSRQMISKLRNKILSSGKSIRNYIGSYAAKLIEQALAIAAIANTNTTLFYDRGNDYQLSKRYGAVCDLRIRSIFAATIS